MVEATSESFVQVAPNAGKKLVLAKGTTANANDIITVSGLTVVEGVLSIYATDGTAGAITITGTTNVVTVTSAAKTYNMVVIGY